jgi:hypothetical protein
MRSECKNNYCFVVPFEFKFNTYRLLTQSSSFRQCIGHFSRPAFLVVPVFKSFKLSGHSGFTVIPAFRSSWLFSCRSKITKRGGAQTAVVLTRKQLVQKANKPGWLLTQANI